MEYWLEKTNEKSKGIPFVFSKDRWGCKTKVGKIHEPDLLPFLGQTAFRRLALNLVYGSYLTVFQTAQLSGQILPSEYLSHFQNDLID